MRLGPKKKTGTIQSQESPKGHSLINGTNKYSAQYMIRFIYPN